MIDQRRRCAARIDGVLSTAAIAVSWLVALLLVAEPLRNTSRYTMGDTLSVRMRERPVRLASAAVTPQCFCWPAFSLSTTALTCPLCSVRRRPTPAMICYCRVRKAKTGWSSCPICSPPCSDTPRCLTFSSATSRCPTPPKTAVRRPVSPASLDITLVASAMLPSLLFSWFWRGFNTAGALCGIYGAAAATIVLAALSPWKSVGLVSIVLGFLLGYLGAKFSRERDDDKFAEREVRALTGGAIAPETLASRASARQESTSLPR